MSSPATHLQVLNSFLAKADGKDKLTAFLQYACLYLSAGEAGGLKKVQASVTAARKVFRVMRPLELLGPLLVQPVLSGKQPVALEVINKLKTLCMVTYFAGDHLAWAHQVGLLDKKIGDKYGKLSIAGWAYGSLLSALGEIYQISLLQVKKNDGESDDDYLKRVEAAKVQINKHLIALVGAVIQSYLAFSVKGTFKLSPRKLGLLGAISSAYNIYLVYPAYPKK